MNLYDDIPVSGEEETVEILFQNPYCKVERIISHGQITASDAWYDQTEDEWVTLLQGEAVLQIESETVCMRRGDTVLIKAGRRHRVTFTSKDPPAVWLCIFLKAGF
jgi:cupin 2 domain-containing protein